MYYSFHTWNGMIGLKGRLRKVQIGVGRIQQIEVPGKHVNRYPFFSLWKMLPHTRRYSLPQPLTLLA